MKTHMVASFAHEIVNEVALEHLTTRPTVIEIHASSRAVLHNA